MTKQKPTLIEHFKDIQDPRLQRKQLHKLDDIFFITLCAVICGCDGWVAIEKFANMKRNWFDQYLSLEYGIPSHDTFGRVFSLIEPEQFQACFFNWIKAVVKSVTGDVIAIDGKCLRRSHDKSSNKSAIYMVSAWSHDNQLTLGQVKVDEKSNEITALPALLENLDITGAIITTDYVSALKGNQSTLHDDVTLFFENTPRSYIESLASHKTVEKNHGRIEEREVTTCNDIDWLTKEHGHPYLASIISVKSRRFHNNEWSQEIRYFISSVKHNDAEKFGHYVRAHWGVENNLHWALDMAFDEDSCRIRKGFADQNMAILRHISLNLLKSETEHKVGIKIKRRMAGWDNDYLLKVLQIF
ncbi:ISAs1 family transposase [Pseudoalteromonas sp. NEC-BIFX-2020_015]|uniref:ISAs1 family transposase n=1 Tax=Pseudoalteromonas sp. NEC-BIFX-2020_015 TaxID=2729544 RepID=UPI0014614EF1|nr:ISAs1 family transposase [Pseudoalteromonas sp. NEC-BIFX-2020_015]NMR26295.1 ISAs1 family transposase [Pseudoalteromonas sp. NEC-BIFX-2020_015]